MHNCKEKVTICREENQHKLQIFYTVSLWQTISQSAIRINLHKRHQNQNNHPAKQNWSNYTYLKQKKKLHKDQYK